MVDPGRLVQVARGLATGPSSSPEALRRSVSTAYYALFHALAEFAARRFVGPDERSPAFTMLYRSLGHAAVKRTLVEINKANLSQSAKQALGRTTVSQQLRTFAEVFVPLQELRHLADYHPFMTFTQAEVLALLDWVELALEAVEAADEAERTDVIAMMVVGHRGSS